MTSGSLGDVMVSMVAQEEQEVWVRILFWAQYFPFAKQTKTKQKPHDNGLKKKSTPNSDAFKSTKRCL